MITFLGKLVSLFSYIYIYIDNTQWRKLYIALIVVIMFLGKHFYTCLTLACTIYMYNIHVHVTHNVIMLVITFMGLYFTHVSLFMSL